MTKEIEKNQIIDTIDMTKKKAEILIENIKSKEMIEDFLHNKITKEELAYMLAEDTSLRKVTEKVTEGIINPEPTKVIKAERDNVAIDFVFGFSTFIEGMKQPIEQKVNAAVEVKDVIDKVSIAVDKSESPKMREAIYEDLGLDDDQITNLIPEEEVEEYKQALMGYYRDEHMERLNMKSIDELSEADEEIINNLVDDSMSMVDSGSEQIPNNFSYGQEPQNGYMDEYGMSPEELNAIFADARGEDIYDYPPFEEIDNLENYPTMGRAINNIEKMYNESIEDNTESLSRLQALEATAPDMGLSNDDIEDLNDDYFDYLTNSEPPSLSDDDLADLDGLCNGDQIER